MTATVIPFPARPAPPREDRPYVSLQLLMAASGRCSCDECLRSFRQGNRDAGRVPLRSQLRVVSD